MKKKRIGVITGASSGMGREFARMFDRLEDLDELWLIARNPERLMALSDELTLPCRLFALDLTDPESMTIYADALKSEKPCVKILVNAAGFGKFLAFTDTPMATLGNMIDLNAKALMETTYLTLPYMRRGGRIFQMGSLSAFQPVPYINVYGASKAFVLSFSRALNVELRGRGIRVMAVCPGWVRTDFFDRAMEDATISYFNRFYEPEDVVYQALIDMERGKDVSICGRAVRAQVLATKLLPHKLVMAIWCRQQKK